MNPNYNLARDYVVQILSLINVGDNKQEVIDDKIEAALKHLSFDGELPKIFIGQLKMEETMRENQLIKIKNAVKKAEEFSGV